MRHGIQALAVPLFFLATLTVFGGRPRAGGMLPARVAQLEALVAEQQAILDEQPVVIDANGAEVGSSISYGFFQAFDALVTIDLEGVPRFVLGAKRDGFIGVSGETLHYETFDCSGPRYGGFTLARCQVDRASTYRTQRRRSLFFLCSST